MLILQHPQEAKSPLGTARLLSLALPQSVHRVGLSWPSLSRAYGKPVESRRWAVLFVGARKESAKVQANDAPFRVVTKSGQDVPLEGIEGIVLLDGNWKQSKTLWWRNPWLLKLPRIILNPENSSAWGTLRKQPRKVCLSTIEAAAESLEALGEKKGVGQGLRDLFDKFVNHAEGRTKNQIPNSDSDFEPDPQE